MGSCSGEGELVSTWRPSRRTAEGRSPRPVSESLGALARSLGAPGVGVLAAVFAHWEELVGPDIAAHAHPRSLRDGVLVVVVDQPAWATQLRFLSGDVLARLHEAAGPTEVRELQVRVSGEPPAGRGRRRSHGGAQ